MFTADTKEWLCNTCRLAIKKERWPKLSIINGMGFPAVPTELNYMVWKNTLFVQDCCFSK